MYKEHLLLEQSELWLLYIILKKILYIVLCKWMKRGEITLLQTLIKEYEYVFIIWSITHSLFLNQDHCHFTDAWTLRLNIEAANSISSRKISHLH